MEEGTQPQVNNTQNVVMEGKFGNSSKAIWVVIAILVVLVGVAGYLYFRNQQNQTQTSRAQTEAINALERDLNALQVGDIDADFSTLDQDLNSL